MWKKGKREGDSGVGGDEEEAEEKEKGGEEKKEGDREKRGSQTGDGERNSSNTQDYRIQLVWKLFRNILPPGQMKQLLF